MPEDRLYHRGNTTWDPRWIQQVMFPRELTPTEKAWAEMYKNCYRKGYELCQSDPEKPTP